MSRRAWIACIVFVMAGAGWAAFAAEPPAIGTNLGIDLDLKEELEKGLKARRPVEFQYIAELTKLVAAGDVPDSLVASSFICARKKPSRQIQYFQFAMKARGDQMGIRTPSLDDQFINPYTGTLMTPALEPVKQKLLGPLTPPKLGTVRKKIQAIF